MNKVLKYLTNPNKLILALLNKNLFFFLSDKTFLKIKYYANFKRKLNLNSPKTFNEKLQWLKLYDRKSIYSKMVDKYEVKEYVSSIIGKDYIIPTIGVYDRFEDIDFNILPNQFVIKCTHDSGGLVICKDKSKLNIDETRKIINKYLKRKYYYIHREWPYKNVVPRIIIEKYMTDQNDELEDYKVHNFNGIPKVILVCRDRYSNNGLTEDFFDIKWNHLNIKRPLHNNSNHQIVKPDKLQEMLLLSKKLSNGIPFVRTDFYIINNKIYFGEITFYPASGFAKFEPEEWDLRFGDWIKIDGK